jgi:hypothetical protein
MVAEKIFSLQLKWGIDFGPNDKMPNGKYRKAAF